MVRIKPNQQITSSYVSSRRSRSLKINALPTAHAPAALEGGTGVAVSSAIAELEAPCIGGRVGVYRSRPEEATVHVDERMARGQGWTRLIRIHQASQLLDGGQP